MDPIAYEELAVHAWPAIETRLYRGCLFRAARGYSNRANSGLPLYSSAADWPALIDFAESFYAARQLPANFKVLAIDGYQPIETLLDQRGYQRLPLAQMLAADLSQTAIKPRHPVVLSDLASPEWFAAFANFNQLGSHAPTARLLLDGLAGSIIGAAIERDGQIIACGFGSVEHQSVGLFDIVVAPDYRGCGYGQSVVAAIVQEACRQGATHGYLQVWAGNEPAINLYRHWKFAPVYDYWYQRAATAN